MDIINVSIVFFFTVFASVIEYLIETYESFSDLSFIQIDILWHSRKNVCETLLGFYDIYWILKKYSNGTFKYILNYIHDTAYVNTIEYMCKKNLKIQQRIFREKHVFILSIHIENFIN